MPNYNLTTILTDKNWVLRGKQTNSHNANNICKCIHNAHQLTSISDHSTLTAQSLLRTPTIGIQNRSPQGSTRAKLGSSTNGFSTMSSSRTSSRRTKTMLGGGSDRVFGFTHAVAAGASRTAPTMRRILTPGYRPLVRRLNEYGTRLSKCMDTRLFSVRTIAPSPTVALPNGLG